MRKPAKKKSKKKSPIKKQQIIVLVDGAGNYYELPRATLERSRVSDRRKKKIAAAMGKMAPILRYIPGTAIPGGIAPPKFVEAQQLRYAGFYLTSAKAKR
jgi:hypothetical protein